MKFIDEFLFYEVKGDGKDEIIRKVTKIDVKDKETQTENESSKSEQSSQSNASKIENKELKQSLAKMIFLKWKGSLRNLKKNLIS